MSCLALYMFYHIPCVCYFIYLVVWRSIIAQHQTNHDSLNKGPALKQKPPPEIKTSTDRSGCKELHQMNQLRHYGCMSCVFPIMSTSLCKMACIVAYCKYLYQSYLYSFILSSCGNRHVSFFWSCSVTNETSSRETKYMATCYGVTQQPYWLEVLILPGAWQISWLKL